MPKPVKAKGWADEAEEGQSQKIICGNGHFGCGKGCRIIGFDKDSLGVLAENWNPHVHLCIGCSNGAAYAWGIAFDDLGFLMTAMQNARAGKGFQAATRDEVWALLRKMNVKPVRKPGQIEAGKPAGIPVGQR